MFRVRRISDNATGWAQQMIATDLFQMRVLTELPAFCNSGDYAIRFDSDGTWDAQTAATMWTVYQAWREA